MTSISKLNQISAAIQALWIYQNKPMDQARKEVFSRFTPAEVADYQTMEREESRKDASASDARGTV